jgi:signal transduction histidine kinase
MKLFSWKPFKLAKNIQRSLFVKLLLVFIGTALLVVGIVYGLFWHFSHVHDSVWDNRNRNRLEYANLLIREIGSPPDLAKASAVAEQAGLRIRIEGPNLAYASSAEIPSLEVLNKKAHHCVWEATEKIATLNGRIFLGVNRGDLNYIFSYENANFLDERPEWGPIFIALVLMALLLNYLSIRWLFKPLEWLSQGVQALQAGRFDHQVKARENDELGDLIKSFNRMTAQISEMLQAKEQLLLDVSHELRSPITRMKVALELDDEKSKDQIKKNIRDLEVMIAELLESARLDTPQGGLVLAPANVSTVIEKVTGKFKDEKPGILVKEIPEALMLQIDQARVETVLKNILENALKYSHHQKHRVEISVPPPVETQDAEHVYLQVRDYGYGIPEEECSLIFEPFYRIDKSRVRETGGYGLGLALCKKIMLAHRGSIEVTSSEKTGTVFTLKFPRFLVQNTED